MKKQSVPRWRAGFTLAEVMVVVALIVILAAIAVPSVAVLRRNLKMTELDACAKDIFIAAQSNLTGLKSRGTLSQLKDSTPTQAPEGELESTTVCYLTQSDPSMKQLLPVGAIDGTVVTNNYVIVFDSASATVLDVYYTEERLSAAEAIALRDDPSGRRKHMLGYYGGSNVISEPSVTRDLPTPMLTLENGEELTAKVTLDLSGLEAATISQLTLTLTLSDGTRSQTLSFPALDIVGGSSYSLVLDSLTGTKFKTSCSSLTPGADITGVAALSYNGPSDTYLPTNSSPATTNSLFASRQGSSVKISYPRHLQNLDQLTSGVVPQITGAALDRRIEWPGSVTLIPIENSALISFDGGENVISGLNIAPRTHAAGSPAGLFGALAGTQPTALNNIRIENATLTNPTDGPSGLLAGSLTNAQVDNCIVYVVNNQPYADLARTYAVSGSGDLGGLVGRANTCTFSYSAVGLPVLSAGSLSNTRVGGLIGRATKCAAVTGCYAAVDQMTGQAIQAAMLIGRAEEVPAITSCYAVGNIQVVTPFAKHTEDIQVSQISGFMNNNPTAKLKDCYAAVTYLDEKGKDRDVTIMYSFAPEREQGKGGALDHCAYMTTGVRVYNAAQQEGEATDYKALTKWRGGGFTASSDLKRAFPYQDGLRGRPYPFPLLNSRTGDLISHHGSWPKEPKLRVSSTGLAYLEAYGDKKNLTYGCYSIDQAGKVWSSLDDTQPIYEENSNAEKALPTYGILLEKDVTLESLGDVTYGNGVKTSADDLFHTGGGTTIEVDGKYFYPFKNNVIRALDGACYDNPQFSASFRFDSQPSIVFYINPRLAAGVASKTDEKGSPWTEDHPLQVRTAEQLAHACSEPGDNTHFKQTHDIDASSMRDTSLGTVNNHKVFDGNGHAITGLRNPLFGAVHESTLKNITIDAAQIETSKNTGIFAQTIDAKEGATILNCNVTNSEIYSDNAAVAGFAHTVGATTKIENSLVSGVTVTSKNGAASGFADTTRGSISTCAVRGAISGKTAAGFVRVNDAKISHCFSNVRIKAATSAFGFSGQNWSITSQISNCYTVGSAEVQAGAAYGFADPSIDVINCYSAVVLTGDNCYGFSSAYMGDSAFYMAQDGLKNGGGTPVQPEQWPELAARLGATVWETSPSGFPALKSNPHAGSWPTPPEVTK